MQVAVEIFHLTKAYDGVTAVEDLSLSVPSGCLFGFLAILFGFSDQAQVFNVLGYLPGDIIEDAFFFPRPGMALGRFDLQHSWRALAGVQWRAERITRVGRDRFQDGR